MHRRILNSQTFLKFKRRERSKKPDNHMQIIRQKYNDGSYKRVIGIDPGYKVWISGVIRYLRTGEEFNYERTSRKFHNSTGKKKRERRAKRLTGAFENRRRVDAENREIYPAGTPSANRRENWRDYIKWRFKWFNDGFSAYTDIRYTRLDLDKYFQTQKVMDKMVNELVGNDPALVCIGSANFSSSAPIKKYIRCPGTKMVLNYLKKKTNVDVLLIDEFNTSQVCGHCHSFFNREVQNRHEWKGRRFKQCTVTNCQIRFQNPIGHTNAIVAKRNHRQIQKESQAYPVNFDRPLPTTKYVRHVKSNNWLFGLVTKKEKNGKNENQKLTKTTKNHRNYQTPFQNAIGHTNVIVTNQNHCKNQKKIRAYPDGPKLKYVCNVRNNNWGLVTERGNQKLTWNRDTSGARNILYKGVCAVLNIPLHANLVRPPRQHRTRAEELAHQIKYRPIAVIRQLLRDFHITPPRRPAQNNAQNDVQNDQQNDVQNDLQNDAQNDQQLLLIGDFHITPPRRPAQNNAQNDAQNDQQLVPQNVLQENYFFLHY